MRSCRQKGKGKEQQKAKDKKLGRAVLRQRDSEEKGCKRRKSKHKVTAVDKEHGRAAERTIKSQGRQIPGRERGREDKMAGEGESQGEGKVGEVKDKEQGTSAVLLLSQRLANQDTFFYKYSRLRYMGHTSPSPPSFHPSLASSLLLSIHLSVHLHRGPCACLTAGGWRPWGGARG